MKTYMLVVDPGLLSGVVLIKLDTWEILFSGDLEFKECGDKINSILATFGSDIICVGEKFIITAQTASNSQAPWSLEVLGVYRWLIECYNAGGLTLYTPAESKSFASNKLLRSLGLWHKGGGGHANDAFRVGVVYMANHDIEKTRILTAIKGLQEA